MRQFFIIQDQTNNTNEEKMGLNNNCIWRNIISKVVTRRYNKATFWWVRVNCHQEGPDHMYIFWISIIIILRKNKDYMPVKEAPN